MVDDNLARFIDHSVLGPSLRTADVSAACVQALQFGFRAVCVPSGFVAHAKRLLADSGVGIASTVGFPHGNAAADAKAHEARLAVELGADEVDYVISIGAALDGDLAAVHDEARAILVGVDGAGVKAILETGYFAPEQLWNLGQTLLDAGVTILKTCTGFGPRGASENDVRVLASVVAGRGYVKASAGIRDRETALAMLRAGASILGTSRGPAICSEPV